MQTKYFYHNNIEILNKRVSAFLEGYRQNIAVFGNDTSELSYIVEKYLLSNKLDNLVYIRTLPIYVNADCYLRNIASSLLSGHLNISDELDTLINLSQQNLVATTNFIKLLLQKGTVNFSDILELINKFINETSRKCVFIIEEFTKLSSILSIDYESFAKFIILQQNCMLILLSSDVQEAEKVIFNNLNLLFGNFENLYLTENSFANNYEYLTSHIKLKTSTFFNTFLISILGSNLIYYDQLIEFLNANFQNEISEEELIFKTLTDLVYLPKTYFFEKFISKIHLLKEQFKSDTEILKLLLLLSQGYLRKNELLSLKIFNPKTLVNKIDKLKKFSYINEYGNIYKIKDQLFSFWLEKVFKIYHFYPFATKEFKFKKWKETVTKYLNIFKNEFYKAKTTRIVELIKLFKDDNIKIKQQRYTLPTAEKISIFSYPDKRIHLIVTEGNEIIFAALKETDVYDTDIVEFLKHSSALKAKKIKKIFISTSRFTSQAQLIAKDKKLILWDNEVLNQLLNIYNKPLIYYGNENNCNF